MIDVYQAEVDRLTDERNDLEARAIAEEAELSRTQEEIDEIMRALDPRTDDTTRKMIARGIGITYGGAEGLREFQERLGELHEPLTEHGSRAKAFRSRVAAIDRRIGEYEAAIDRLRKIRDR